MVIFISFQQIYSIELKGRSFFSPTLMGRVVFNGELANLTQFLRTNKKKDISSLNNLATHGRFVYETLVKNPTFGCLMYHGSQIHQ